MQLQQVILNLVINGSEAMKTITDRVRELLIRSHPQGGKLVAAVQGSGTGLDQHRAEQLFEAFYTSKPEGRFGVIDKSLNYCRARWRAICRKQQRPRRHLSVYLTSGSG